eukprot:gene6884-4957_t
MSSEHGAEPTISKKSLCKFDNSIMTIDELVALLRQWAMDKVASGTAISLEEIPHGVEFRFKSAPSAWLKLIAVQTSQSVELEQRASVPSSLPAPVQSLVSTVMNSLVESLSDELMNLIWKASQAPQTRRRSPEDDLIVDEVRKTFNVASDIEIVEVDDENEFDIAAIQRELRQQAEVHAQLQNGSFWSSMWNVTDIDDQDASGSGSSASVPTAVELAPHAASTSASASPPESLHGTEKEETVSAGGTEPSAASATRSAASRDDGSSEVVYAWQNVPNVEANNHRVTSLVSFLRQWAASYCQKGIGVSATSIASGCRVTFLALEDAHLNVFVTVEPAADGTTTIRVVDAIVAVDGAHAALREQLQYPIQSIRDSLQRELRRLDVAGMRAPTVVGAKPSAHDSDELTAISRSGNAAVEHEPTTISNAGSAAFASIDEKDALFKEVAEYNTPDLQSEAVKQLEVILRRTREQGMYRVLQEYHDQEPPSAEAAAVSTGSKRTAANAASADASSVMSVNTTTTQRSDEWSTLFTLGKEISELNLQKLLDRPSANPFFESAEELQRPPPQFPVAVDDVASWQSGEKIDIFAGPQGLYQNTADPRLPSMRERYDAARQRGGASSAAANGDEGDDDGAALLDYAGFLDRLDAVKPKFDTDLLAFLNHHLFHDEQRLRRHDEALQALAYRPRAEPDAAEQRHADLLPESEEKRLRRWVQVLRILQQGVTAELERRHELSIEMLTVLLRVFDPRIRRPLFERYVNLTATTDLQALRTLAVNMVERLLDAPTMRQDADIQRFWQSASMGRRTPAQWRLMLECLRREVDEFLSDAVIEQRLRRYNEQLAEQGLTLGLRHRNPITQAAIESADRLDQRQIAPRSQMPPDRWLPGQPGAPPPRPSNTGQYTTSHDFPTI